MQRHVGGAARGLAGFSLVELLITIAIVGVLLALLLPGMGGVAAKARSFACQANQRTTAFDFVLFADDGMHGDRGADSGLGSRFHLETFVESAYCVHEFWCWPDEQSVTLQAGQHHDVPRCPDVQGDVMLRRGTRCESGAIGPPESLSFGFNIWLHRPEVRDATGRPRIPQVALSDAAILGGGNIPLFWDVAGDVAMSRGVPAIFTGPSLDSTAYADDRVWFPAYRHGGKANFAFIDGHVSSSGDPLNERDWRWRIDQPR